MEALAREVWASLGPGYSERVYHNAMEVVLRRHAIPYETERIVPVLFEGHTIGNLRADLIVDRALVVELKSVARLTDVFRNQTRNYLTLTGIPRGLLINFPSGASTDIEIEEIKLSESTATLAPGRCSSTSDPVCTASPCSSEEGSTEGIRRDLEARKICTE
jgi:GxxExxY protein